MALQEESDAVLPHRGAALLRRRALRAGARERRRRPVERARAAALPAAGLAVRAQPQHEPPAAVRRHPAADVGHQGAGVPRVHLQEGDGGKRFSQVRADRQGVSAEERPRAVGTSYLGSWAGIQWNRK